MSAALLRHGACDHDVAHHDAFRMHACVDASRCCFERPDSFVRVLLVAPGYTKP
jgi:hypothetical protein